MNIIVTQNKELLVRESANKELTLLKRMALTYGGSENIKSRIAHLTQLIATLSIQAENEKV